MSTKAPGVQVPIHLRSIVLGDSLGPLGDGVLGKLSGEEEADSGLDLSAGDRGLLVVPGQSAGFAGQSLKDILDKVVH